MSRRIATLSAALVLALLGTFLVVVYVGRAEARALQGLEAVPVLVAAGPLPEGVTVADAQAQGLITTQELPRKLVPAEGLTELTEADAQLVFANDVTPGEILQRPRLVEATEVKAPSQLRIPEGKLAVTVELQDPMRVGSFLAAGSEVVIFNTFQVYEGRQDVGEQSPAGTVGPSGDLEANNATRVLLPRVSVLAVGAAVGGPPPAEGEELADPNAAGLSPTLVTVGVNQDEAQRLIHAARTGALYLGLLDTYDVQPDAGVDTRSLFDQ